MDSIPAPFALIITTNQYAGNFERPLCAYMTGCVGECRVGKECADAYERDGLTPSDWVCDAPDDQGCLRPASVWSEDDNAAVIWLRRQPPYPDLQLWTERAKKFAADPGACGADRYVPEFSVLDVRLVKLRLDVETVFVVPV